MATPVSVRWKGFVDALIEFGDQFTFYLRCIGSVPKTIKSYGGQVV